MQVEQSIIDGDESTEKALGITLEEVTEEVMREVIQEAKEAVIRRWGERLAGLSQRGGALHSCGREVYNRLEGGPSLDPWGRWGYHL